jgi:hypothetical protein
LLKSYDESSLLRRLIFAQALDSLFDEIDDA